MKENISNSYIEEQKKKYKAEFNPRDRKIAITGAELDKSIGQAIITYSFDRYRTHHYTKFNQNVIGDYFDFRGFTDLVLCHGYTHMDWIENMDLERIENTINVNLYGSIRVIQQFVKDNINDQCRKKIIVIGSMAYRNVLNGSSIYCASKAGLNMFVRCIAWELAPKGFDVYIVHPSNVLDTPMTEETIKQLMRYRNLSREQAEMYWGSSLPRESFLTKYEIAKHVNYLLMHDTSYLAGNPIELAGGQR